MKTLYMMKEDFMPRQPLVDTFQGVGGGGATCTFVKLSVHHYKKGGINYDNS